MNHEVIQAHQLGRNSWRVKLRFREGIVSAVRSTQWAAYIAALAGAKRAGWKT